MGRAFAPACCPPFKAGTVYSRAHRCRRFGVIASSGVSCTNQIVGAGFLRADLLLHAGHLLLERLWGCVRHARMKHSGTMPSDRRHTRAPGARDDTCSTNRDDTCSTNRAAGAARAWHHETSAAS